MNMTAENTKQIQKYEIEVTNSEMKERILQAQSNDSLIDTVLEILNISSRIKFFNHKVVNGDYIKENYTTETYNELIEEYVTTEDIQNYIMNKNNLTDDDFFLITEEPTGEEYLNCYYTANDFIFLKSDLAILLSNIY